MKHKNILIVLLPKYLKHNPTFPYVCQNNFNYKTSLYQCFPLLKNVFLSFLLLILGLVSVIKVPVI